jgi:hypothetical protein
MLMTFTVEACTAHVVGESESVVFAWTVLSPSEAGQIQGPSLEEKVLIVTKKALYCCK